jgi:membrane protein CcdC involved in cytochrome C biogenesis
MNIPTKSSRYIKAIRELTKTPFDKVLVSLWVVGFVTFYVTIFVAPHDIFWARVKAVAFGALIPWSIRLLYKIRGIKRELRRIEIKMVVLETIIEIFGDKKPKGGKR